MLIIKKLSFRIKPCLLHIIGSQRTYFETILICKRTSYEFFVNYFMKFASFLHLMHK